MFSRNEERPLLEVQDVYVGYTPETDVIQGVSLDVKPAEIVSIVGLNGAGKTTLLKALYGLVEVKRGRILYNDRDITGIKPQRALKVGITFLPQHHNLFPQMTVYENLELGMYLEKERRRIRLQMQRILDLFPLLVGKLKQKANTLTDAEQRLLEIARALMWEPRLILMDEPSVGFPPEMMQMVFDNIVRLNHEIGLTVVMNEQNVHQAVSISHRNYVLEAGKIIYEGGQADLLNNAQVKQTFQAKSPANH